MINIPSYFLADGRGPDLIFEQDELLFFRFNKKHYPSKGERLPSLAIRFPDCSVNREKYSQPSDVLIPFPAWIHYGIAQFPVKTIPPYLLTNDEARRIEFAPKHDPIDENHEIFDPEIGDNYAHCELRAFENENHLKKENDIPRLLRKTFRIKIMEGTEIRIGDAPEPLA